MEFKELEWRFQDVDNCVLCGKSPTWAVVFESEIRGVPLRFVQCPDCTFVFQNPRLTDDSLDEYFSSKNFICDGTQSEMAFDEHLGYYDYFDWDDCYRSTAGIRLKRLSRFRAPPARLLEIGPASGSFLDEARSRGFAVSGLDISSAFAGFARETYGLDIEVGAIETHVLPEEHYDIVCAFGGISCWKDLRQGLGRVNATLRPGGLLAFNYSDFYGWPRRLRGDRYFEFNHASLSLLHRKVVFEALRLHGFEVLEHATETQVASLGRIGTYLKLKPLQLILDKMGLAHLQIPVKAIGTKFVLCRKSSGP